MDTHCSNCGGHVAAALAAVTIPAAAAAAGFTAWLAGRIRWAACGRRTKRAAAGRARDAGCYDGALREWDERL